MHMRVIEISVGVFLLLGLLALLFLAVRVSGIDFQAAGTTYDVHARFDDVSGLRSRARVSLAGVGVGRVTDIRVDARYGEATVTMAIRADIELPQDTGAAIKTEGLLGGRYVALLPGGEEELLSEDDTIVNTQSALVLEDVISDFLINL